MALGNKTDKTAPPSTLDTPLREPHRCVTKPRAAHDKPLFARSELRSSHTRRYVNAQRRLIHSRPGMLQLPGKQTLCLTAGGGSHSGPSPFSHPVCHRSPRLHKPSPRPFELPFSSRARQAPKELAWPRSAASPQPDQAWAKTARVGERLCPGAPGALGRHEGRRTRARRQT